MSALFCFFAKPIAQVLGARVSALRADLCAAKIVAVTRLTRREYFGI